MEPHTLSFITYIVSTHTLSINTALDFPEKAKTTKTALNINRDAQYSDTILVIGQYSVNTGYILADSGNAC